MIWRCTAQAVIVVEDVGGVVEEGYEVQCPYFVEDASSAKAKCNAKECNASIREHSFS
jgi:hypothetical protein